MKEWACLKCGNAIRNISVVDGKSVATSKRKYCLNCSPYGSRNTKKLHLADLSFKKRNCSVCGKYINDKHHKGYRCHTCNTKIARYRQKIRAVNYLGGSCNRCGWSGPSAAFEFHHRDPADKEKQVGSLTQNSWANIVKELDKCELLCSNCHRIHHSWINGPLREAIEKDIEDHGGIRLVV